MIIFVPLMIITW